MNRAICMLLASVVTALPTRVVAQQTARDSVLAVVNEFFRAMTARDTAAFARTQLLDGVMYAVLWRGDSTQVGRQTIEATVRLVGSARETFVERMWDPTVHIHGPIAVVWTPYDFHRDGKFSHCGVDAFTLVREATGWKIATATYTVEPTGCAPSPLGPVR